MTNSPLRGGWSWFGIMLHGLREFCSATLDGLWFLIKKLPEFPHDLFPSLLANIARTIALSPNMMRPEPCLEMLQAIAMLKTPFIERSRELHEILRHI
eukprot:gene1890-12897_t